MIELDSVKCPKNLRRYVLDRGYSLHGSDYLFGRKNPLNLINAVNSTAIDIQEAPDVSLKIMGANTLQKKHLEHVGIMSLSPGYYPCLYQIKSEKIEKGDKLLVQNYGRSSSLAYGKPDYIWEQQNIIRQYQNILTIVSGNEKLFCQHCFHVSPLFHLLNHTMIGCSSTNKLVIHACLIVTHLNLIHYTTMWLL